MTASVDPSLLEHVRQAVPKHVELIAKVLDAAGHKTWIVGGSLRDQLRARLGQLAVANAADWDLATDARPEQVQRLFKKVIPTGIKHGTVTVLLNRQGYEVTTLRGEVGYSDGRRPDSVFFVDEIREDLARRDFTINAIAYDPLAQRLEDPFDGVADLQKRLIRAVGDPRERFDEDGLRVLRAARFVATLEFELDPTTRAAIEPSLASFAKVSLERVRDEWVKAMKSRKPSLAFEVMQAHGMLRLTAPELTSDDSDTAAWQLALRAMDLCEPGSLVRFAALLHNLDRHAGTTLNDALRPDRAAELAFERLKALRFSNKERDHIVSLIRHQVPPDASSVSDADLRRWLRRVGVQELPELKQLMLAIADASNNAAARGNVEQVVQRADALLASRPALSIRDLCMTGGDLKQALNLPSGPMLGRLLDALLDAVLEAPELNDRERLLEVAQRWLDTHST